MKFSWGWICDYLDPIPNALSMVEDVLIQAGIEVESVLNITHFPGFEVVRVDKVEKHPDSDHLNVCQVNGKQIVCGASNVREGMYTVLGNIGSVVPKNGMILAKVKIRGVESNGMLCSAEELDLIPYDNSEDGILDLDVSKKIPTIEDILLPNGPIFDVSITPNRGDLLNVYGIARELAAFGLGTLKKPNLYSLKLDFEKSTEVIDVQDDAVSCMYTAQVSNLKNNDSPHWLKTRLKEVGINSKSCVVDITNYLAHALGQPLHAFDNDVIKKIEVRKYSGEFVDLKGNKHQLKDLPAMVANNVCVSVPGVIGGNHGKTEPSSTNILFEAANYDMKYIYDAQKMVTNTDASKKFFNGIDPEMTAIAIEEAVGMTNNLCGCEVGRATVAKSEHRKEIKIEFPNQYIKSLGISQELAKEYLSRLGFVETSDHFLVPTWRYYVNTPEALLHEIVRMHDINKIEDQSFTCIKAVELKDEYVERLRQILVAEGLYEVYNRGFMSKNMNSIFEQDPDLYLENPMSSSQYTLRNTILGNLAECFESYGRYSWSAPGIFEIGTIFRKNQNGSISEERYLGIALKPDGSNWLTGDSDRNFFHNKRIIEKCIKSLYGSDVKCRHNPKHKVLSESCEWYLSNGEVVGSFGLFSKVPNVLKSLGMKHSAYMAEIRLEKSVNRNSFADNQSLTRHEFVVKDLSFNRPSTVFTSQVIEKLRADLGGIEIKIFDIYPDSLMVDGDSSDSQRSVSISLTWSNLEKTMTNEEIQIDLQKAKDIITGFGCTIRGENA